MTTQKILTALTLATLSIAGTGCSDDGGGGMAGAEDVNPFDGDAQAAMEGETLYTNNGCPSCHGADGMGTSDAFPALDDAAANWSDKEIFDNIKFGVDGTVMAPYEEVMTDDEIWKVVTHVRTYAQ